MGRLSCPVPRESQIAPSRKIIFTAALALAALGPPPGAATAKRVAAGPARSRGAGLGGPRTLVRASLAQAGRELVFSVRTRRPLPLKKLQPLPDPRRKPDRYLCLVLSRPGHGGERRLCIGGGQRPRHRVGVAFVNAEGKTIRAETVAATVKRPEPRKLAVALEPAAAGLTPQRYRWRAIASAGCEPGQRCAESLPSDRPRGFRLRPVRAVGCSAGSGLLSSGPRDRRVVALTFDDGPSDYTPGFLQVLREKHAVGTFFEIGQEMPGREATMREILAQGSELGDHTMNHVEYPDYGQIAAAASRIEEYTHFAPCLFRPPGGAVDDRVVSTAGGLGMWTITWDVDPTDWSNPGSTAVYGRIVDATRPGSIVLMHDGGGDRGGTLAALPLIIDALRARGYRFATVTDLLGGRVFYRPYG